jgi:predicted ArsR family transcriptional regulator
MAQDDDRDLFETTRGKILLMLCHGPRTVNELMEELGVTDNAVRAQLANLQQGGLVRQVGLRPGTRKPHVDYELTPKARLSFPSAYEPVLRTVVDVLRERLPARQTEPIMKEAAQRLLTMLVGELREKTPDRRAAEFYRKLKDISPGVLLVDQPGHFEVRACGCPLASVTASHPEICDLLGRVLTDLLGTKVRERCDRAESPRCCFEVVKEGAQ